MQPLIYTFGTEAERTTFMDAVAKLPESKFIRTTTFQEEEPKYFLFVGGKQIMEGTKEQLNTRFMQETASHSASVQIKRRHYDKWTVVRSRQRQV